jgi:PAS domain S-box-containing protein
MQSWRMQATERSRGERLKGAWYLLLIGIAALVTTSVTLLEVNPPPAGHLRERWVELLMIVPILAIVAGIRTLYSGLVNQHAGTESVSDLRALNSRLEQLSLKHELILNAAADGIVGIGVDGHATFLNRAAEGMLGWPLAELSEGSIHTIVHHTRTDGTPFPLELCPALRAIQSGETTFVTDDLFWRKDGTSFSTEYSATPMRNAANETIGAVVMFRDITDRRAVQRLKDEFVSLVSHELRTPLTSIRGALGLLAGGLLTSAPEKGQRMLEIAVNNTDRLVRLINDILDIERIDSGKVVLMKVPCLPATLIQDSIDVMHSMAEKSGVSIEIGSVATAEVLADPDRIAQTITNLLGNAVKFSQAGTTISISAEEAGDGVVFRVRDQGRGIPAGKLDAVFERFQQADASDAREKGGSGLGLTICRSIVGQHGGVLRVESIVGEGSVFSFALQRATPRQVIPEKGSRPRVLICDDDRSILEMLETMLEQRGYDIAQVSSGEDLVMMARSFTPDVILLDLFMPGMSGWDTMAALREDETCGSIPVVILSVLSPEETSAPFGLAGWVSKPMDEQTLVDTLQSAVGLGRRKPRVLIIEDDFDLARVVIESFERRGIEIYHAATGRDAIALAGKITPDLLILDLVLPDLDGFAVVDWLRTHKQLRRVPLVVYSAAESAPDEQERLRLGPTEFLTKSRVPPEEFERRVVHLLDALTTNGRGLAHVA